MKCISFMHDFDGKFLIIVPLMHFNSISSNHHLPVSFPLKFVRAWLLADQSEKKLLHKKKVVSSNFESTVCWLIVGTLLMVAFDCSSLVRNWDSRVPFRWRFEVSYLFYCSTVYWKNWKCLIGTCNSTKYTGYDIQMLMVWLNWIEIEYWSIMHWNLHCKICMNIMHFIIYFSCKIWKEYA